MSDQLKKLLEQQEYIQRLINPYGDIQSQMTAMVNNVSKSYLFCSHNGLESERLKLLASLDTLGDSAYHGLDNRLRIGAGGALEEARYLGLISQTSNLAEMRAAVLSAQAAYAHQFRLPKILELSDIAKTAFETSLARTVFSSAEPLQAVMASMSSPWLLTGYSETSAKALCNILAIGKGIDGPHTFQHSFTESLRQSLGDWRDSFTPDVETLKNPAERIRLYLERGFDSELTDFTPEAFDEGLRAAGLDISYPEQASNDCEADCTRSSVAFNCLWQLEVAIRRYIERVMLEKCGPKWMKQRIPQKLLESWIAKRDKAVNAGQAGCPLIDYADFTEYSMIIERNDNWQDIFQVTFGRREDIRESFQRLFPVRIATMHARIITLDDELMLRVESKRILNAISRY
ncbi:Swt1 family HEPN domain-containing protein [Pseudomonas cichorii]|uniref:Swt1 family HEPN domain-containing protein n=1 Tax=Pseudomonas cichorii TaxID=36746 RepID=UPI001C8AE234|nr:Swt1 family HEPN domain-containing protein [Pseudomonas cichorii]MBX8493786.1 hypothetical protein [Pseudomonas cichorii]